MRRSFVLIPVTLALAVTPHFAPAQDRADAVSAVVAAIPAIILKAPRGTAVLVYNVRSADLAQRVSASLGRPIVAENDMLVCEQGPQPSAACGIRDGASLINLVEARVTGESARVAFNLETPSGSKSVPIEHQFFFVDLRRKGGGWTVFCVRLVAIS